MCVARFFFFFYLLKPSKKEKTGLKKVFPCITLGLSPPTHCNASHPKNRTWLGHGKLVRKKCHLCLTNDDSVSKQQEKNTASDLCAVFLVDHPCFNVFLLCVLFIFFLTEKKEISLMTRFFVAIRFLEPTG